MAYTDLTAAFVYKTLLTYQLCSDLALNDKLFNDQLSGLVSIPNDVLLGNNKRLLGEVFALGTWRSLAKLDASNIVQIGDAACETRVPADPTNALGVATKQYVDAIQMLQLQPLVTGTPGQTVMATILNFTGKGELHALYIHGDTTNSNTYEVKITIDGTLVFDSTSTAVATNKFRGLVANGSFGTVDGATADLASFLLKMPFRTSLKVEAQFNAAVNTCTAAVLYSKI